MLTVDLVASSAASCGLGHEVLLTDDIVAKEGYCIAGKALGGNEKYNSVEAVDGTFHEIHGGTVLVGTLGGREALKGFRGHIPPSIRTGDVLHLLNMGGILGWCTADHPTFGKAVEVEVLGAVVDPATSEVANIGRTALTPLISLQNSAPIITICGTAMNTGKTNASTAVVAGLAKAGFRVAAAKLTGAALQRDVRKMKEHGATEVATFAECGFVCSTGKNIVPHAKAVLAKLSQARPDVIVVELGDGFIGPYGVDEFLLDRELTAVTRATVVAASDLAGAWAAAKLFSERYRRTITAMVGPVTDNAVGTDYIAKTFGIRAHNALSDPAGLSGAVLSVLATGVPLSPKRQLVA